MLPPVSIRAATPNDIDDLVEFSIAAKPHDPSYTYCYPYREEFPDDLRKYTKIGMEYYLSPTNSDWYPMVAETQLSGDSNNKRIVGCAIWDVSYVNRRKNGLMYEPPNLTDILNNSGALTRQDADHKHLAASDEAMKEAKTSFRERYGIDCLYLRMLHVRQDYWRRGIGLQLARWGVSKAREENLPLGVIATEMGQKLYSHLGFSKIGPVIAQVPGEEESWVCQKMVVEPQQHLMAV